MGDPSKQEPLQPSRSSSKKAADKEPRFSIDAHYNRVFPYFLTGAVSLAIIGACIGSGMNPVMILFLPVTVSALLRRDYRQPHIVSEWVTGRILTAYVILVSIGVAIASERLRIPTFLVYFATGTVFLSAMLPLSDRRISQTIVLSVSIVLINCILTNHILYALILALYVFALMGTLLTFHLACTRPAPGSMAADTIDPAGSAPRLSNLGLYMLIIIAVTIVIFPLIPRPFTPPPELVNALPGGRGLVDFDGTLSYGGDSGGGGKRGDGSWGGGGGKRGGGGKSGGGRWGGGAGSMDKRIAFVARFQAKKPAGPYYWRNRTLEIFHGRKWYPSTRTRRVMEPGQASGERKTFTYQISPYGFLSDRVSTLGRPVQARDSKKESLPITEGGEVIVNSRSLRSSPYTVESVPGPYLAPLGRGHRYLNPGGITRSIWKLADQITEGAQTRRGRTARIMSYLDKGFVCSPRPQPTPGGFHPLEYFLMKSRTGNCTHFAGAAVLLLRSAGVPCRMVQGFMGMEKTYDPKKYIIRFSRHHVWVEALLGDGTWTRLEPSPPAAFCSACESSWWDWYDRLRHTWMRLVVNFSRQDQAALLDALKKFLRTAMSFSLVPNVRIVATAALITAIIGLIILAFLRWSLRKEPDTSAIYLSTMKEMVKQGMLDRIHPWHEENSSEIEQKAPLLRELLKHFTDGYLAARFGDPACISPSELHLRSRDLIEKFGIATRDSHHEINARSKE